MNRAPTVTEVVDSDGGQKFLRGITYLGLLAPFAEAWRIMNIQKDGYSHGVRLFEGTEIEIPETLEIEIAGVLGLALIGLISAAFRN